MLRIKSRKNSGRISLPMMVVLVALGLGVAWWWLNKGGSKVAGNAVQDAGKLLDQAGKAVDKDAAEAAAELERRNNSIQSKRGFDIAK